MEKFKIVIVHNNEVVHRIRGSNPLAVFRQFIRFFNEKFLNGGR